MSYTINSIYHGFRLKDAYLIKEIDATAQIFIHEKSGAQLLHLGNDDDNKVFSVSFRTPPSDHTGVPHIIEHCVLSGSRKYTTKEPFMDMVKGSLKTFINAMTYADKTMYPIASKNDKDFYNLMDVYLDSVFHPQIYTDPEIFMQEGWHYDIHNASDPIEYKGVVYNEMRGAYSSPNTILQAGISQVLYPDTCYKNSSGGDPDFITDLTMEGFLNFHRTFYHPSNSYIYLYGNGDLDKQLAYINDEYLCEFDADSTNTVIPQQKSFVEEATLEISYPVSDDEPTDNKAYLSRSYVIGHATDTLNMLMLETLNHILISSSGAPLKKALLDAGIGEDILFLDDGGLQPQVSIVAKNTSETKADLFMETIDSALQNLISNGIDQNLILSSINKVEYNLREANQFPTKGLIYNIQALDSWLYDGHPTAHLEYSDAIATLRSGIDTGLFENFIKNSLVENNHKALVIMTPEKGLSEKKQARDMAKLAAYKDSLSKAELESLISDNESLKDKQLSPDSKEDLATIPKLNVSDVDKLAEIIPQEIITDQNTTILYHNLFANNIGYVDYIFDTGIIPEDQIPYVNLLADVLGDIDTASHQYADLSNDIYKNTGGISFDTSVFIKNNDDKDYAPCFFVSGKAIGDNMEQLLTLMNEIMIETKFTDKKRIKELLQQIKSRTEMKIYRIGNTVASRRVASYFSPATYYIERLKGLEYYWFITKLINDFDQQFDTILDNLKKVYNTIFNKNNMLVCFIGDQEDFHKFQSIHTLASDNLSTQLHQKTNYSFEGHRSNEGIQSSSNVQYVAKGFNFKRLGFNYHGSMRVLETMLNSEFLHDRVRAKGGAYGCGLSFGKSGNVTVASYRDPNLTETIDVYNDVADFVSTLDISDEDLSKYIIGAIGRIDYATTPTMKGHIGLRNYISNTNHNDLQKERDEILNTTVADIRKLGPLIQAVMDQGFHCVLGNDNKIKDNSHVFNTLLNLNN